MYHHPRREEFELRAVLHLPTGTLTVEETSPSIHEVIDTVADKLAISIGHHKGDLRKRHLHRRRKQRRGQFAAASEYLGRDADASRTDAFVNLLMPYADQLYDHAKRELRALERQGAIPKGEFEASDIVDDLLVKACETYEQRFRDTSIDVWLMDLLNRQLEELRLPEPPLSFATSSSHAIDTDGEDDDLSDIHFWLERLLEQPQPLALDEMVPDERWDDIWDRLSKNEQRDRLAELLQELPRHQRQALMLKDAYGFELFEIVRALGRTSEDIEADLEQARATVRTGFVEAFA